MHYRGDLIEIDGLLAVVVAVAGEDIQTDDGMACVPEDHLALWFGDPAAKRISQGGTGDHVPEVWTVPADYCRAAMNPNVRH
jgi:hypothetical protein